MARTRILREQKVIALTRTVTAAPRSLVVRLPRFAIIPATVAAMIAPGSARADTLADPTGTACVATNGSSAACTAVAVGVLGGNAHATGVGVCPPGMTHANGEPYCVRSQWTSTAAGPGLAVSDSGSATGPSAVSGEGPASATCWSITGACAQPAVAASGTRDAASDHGLAIAGTGSATSTGGLGAASGTGSAQTSGGLLAASGARDAQGGSYLALAPMGNASGGLAASLVGSSAGNIAISVLGEAWGEGLAFSAMGDAHAGWRGAAISILGDAYGRTDPWGNRAYLTVSGAGDAYGGLIAVAPLGRAG